MIEVVRFRLNSDFDYVESGMAFINPMSISHVEYSNKPEDKMIQIIFNNGEHVTTKKETLSRIFNSYE